MQYQWRKLNILFVALCRESFDFGNANILPTLDGDVVFITKYQDDWDSWRGLNLRTNEQSQMPRECLELVQDLRDCPRNHRLSVAMNIAEGLGYQSESEYSDNDTQRNQNNSPRQNRPTPTPIQNNPTPIQNKPTPTPIQTKPTPMHNNQSNNTKQKDEDNWKIKFELLQKQHAKLLGNSVATLTLDELYELSGTQKDAMKRVENAVAAAQLQEKENKKCVICIENTKTTVLIPCGHKVLCDSCAHQKLVQCPVCRAKVASTQRVFE